MSPLEMEMRRAENSPQLDAKAHVSLPDGNPPMRLLLPESAFVSMLYQERRRAERAKRRFVLVLVDVRKALSSDHKDRTLSAESRYLAKDAGNRHHRVLRRKRSHRLDRHRAWRS